jgi:regulator of sigma E protease
MTIILFLVVLAVLIFVHELGHFLVAKKSGIRVDEFAVGFPPKIFSWIRGETKYSINLIPFGGYVKIFGENPDDESISGVDSARSFVNVSKWKQVAVLIAGIAFNVIFAWILLSVSFMFGSLIPVGDSADGYAKYITDSHVVITGTTPDSPALKAGLAKGDRIISVEGVSGADLNTDKIRSLIETNTDGTIDFNYERSGKNLMANIVPETLSGENRKVIGIYMENVGVVRLNPLLAFWEGAKLTVRSTGEVIVGLGKFIGLSLRGQGDLSQVSGPVGIVGMVGDAADFGLAYFLGFVAFISLNLAAINLVPFPALDGGRILFVIIEAVIRRPIKPKVANIVNSVGFLILIALMIFITYRDILKLI